MSRRILRTVSLLYGERSTEYELAKRIRQSAELQNARFLTASMLSSGDEYDERRTHQALERLSRDPIRLLQYRLANIDAYDDFEDVPQDIAEAYRDGEMRPCFSRETGDSIDLTQCCAYFSVRPLDGNIDFSVRPLDGNRTLEKSTENGRSSANHAG